ncbi:MAG: hypothetical protein EOO06_13170 [Chitinophagaceae bacterium]|nr:MAG: hypothetical protein EOO06_13170 [Chitinophagaceae bacterium]
MKLKAEIPEEMIDDEIRYLVIQSDEDDTKGFFLFMHSSLDEPCDADLWFADVEAAKRQAEINYGVAFDDWQTLES